MNPSLPQKDYGDTNFITGLRAFAAVAVVLIHAGGAGLRELGVIGGHIADFGRVGVYVFFVISGFSVASSYASSGNYLDYLNKRLWRVAPLYYFWLLAAVLLSATATYWKEFFGVGIDTYNVLMHVFFLGWLDYRIANTILGVEWTISVEVFWYLVVPFMLMACNTHKRTFGVLAGSFVMYALAKKFPEVLPVDTSNAALAMHWSPIPYVLSYALGIAAYRFRPHCSHTSSTGNWVLIVSVLLLGGYAVRPELMAKIFLDELIFTSLLTTLLIVFGTNKSLLFRIVFVNPAVQFVGVISYGIYLCHLPLLSVFSKFEIAAFESMPSRFLLVLSAAILVSTLTYYLVERQCAAIGKVFGKRVLSLAR